MCYRAKQCDRDQAVNDQENCRQNLDPVNACFGSLEEFLSPEWLCRPTAGTD